MSQLEAYKAINKALEQKREIPELVDTILKSPRAAVIYSTVILKRPWPEAEEIIATCPYSSLIYANEFQCRFKDGEPSIISHPKIKVIYAEKLKEFKS